MSSGHFSKVSLKKIKKCKKTHFFHPQSPHLRARVHLSRQHRWRPDLLSLLSQVLLPGGGGRRFPVSGGKEAQGDGEVNYREKSSEKLLTI